MNKKFLSSLVALSAALSACASSVDLNAPRTTTGNTSSSLFAHSEHRCDADPAQTLVGKTHTDATDQEARTLSGSKSVRTLRPGQVITMEYDPERINLRLDERDVITNVGCG